MAHWYCPQCKNAVLGQNVTYEELHDTCGTKVVWSDGDLPPLLTEETARKIWDAAVKWVDFLENGGPHGDDFETFYKQLIEGK